MLIASASGLRSFEELMSSSASNIQLRTTKSTPIQATKPNKVNPSWLPDLIDAHLEIEAEAAKSAGALGFVARSLVLATMPYKNPNVDVFTRVNGDFRLRIVAGAHGIPFGIYPRLLTTWLATEVVRTQSSTIQLGDSLSKFLYDVMDIKSKSGGDRSASNCVLEQMKKLFGATISAEYRNSDPATGKSLSVRNIQIASSFNLKDEIGLWLPQDVETSGWHSQLKLSHEFFMECLENPVPIDLRAYKALRNANAPAAMDIYTWLTFRLSYVKSRTRPMPWESLMMQFGHGYDMTNVNEAVKGFKKGFLKNLQLVHIVYPEAKFEINKRGLVLLPSRTHIPRVIL